MELEESNYLATFLPLTVISDAMNLAKNLQTVVFVQNQSCTGKKCRKQTVLVLFVSLVEKNLKGAYLYKCFQKQPHILHPPNFSSLPHKHTPSGVARIL